MSLRACSRIGSRNNRRSRVLVALLTFVAMTLPAQEVRHSARFVTTEGYLGITIEVNGGVSEQVLESLGQGMRSEVLFSLRAYVPRSGIAAIFGDRLVLELTPSHTASYDPFRARYVVRTNDGVEYSLQDADQFVRHFTELPEYRLPWSMLPDTGPVYLEIEAIVRPVKLVPPLALLGLWRRDDRMTSERHRYELLTLPGMPQ